jgi:ribokinase
VRAAVVGHVEWVEFARVERVPVAGEIVTARETFAEAAGGGGVAAVQLARLTGGCTLFTALGDDETGARARERLEALGVTVAAATRAGKPTRRGFTFLDDAGERTITVIGERLEARRADPLPWDELDATDAVYFTAGDPGSLRAARAAATVVATARVMDVLEEAAVRLDAVVASGADPSERYRPLEPRPALVAETAGAGGGQWTGDDGSDGRWSAVPVPGPVHDAYGCGDSFAAGLTYALAGGAAPERALAVGAECGAACLAGDGPFGFDLRDRPRAS